jgi:amino acid transporter/nucleotide-binding universal stress UspA family protein
MPNKAPNSQGIPTELNRELGLVSALAIGIGTMVAAGIFTLSGLAIRNVGSAAVLSFLLAAIVASFTALSYCEFVSVYPRSGEGYLYARKTFPAPLAYFVGWALLLGYSASCAFYIASLSTYFHEFIWESPFQAFSGLAALVALTMLNVKGTRESGSFQVIVTLLKVILLVWFVAGGIGKADPQMIMERFSQDVVEIGATAGMVFITFFGFSAIAASAGEVINPVKTIPRAIFWSMGVVTVLYTLVVVAILAADLTEYSESAMGTAARFFLGPVGGMVIVGGALFSMISASNASIMAGSRVALAMSQMGHLPKKVGVINPKTRTPITALVMIGAAIMAFTIALPLEDLAHFADTVLLLVLIFVNAALILHRRKYPDMKRPFRVPLVPLLPALGILANLYLLFQLSHHTGPVLIALAALALGMIGFVIWKAVSPAEAVLPGAPSQLAEEQYAPERHTKNYRILVPVANPENVSRLLDIAAAIAQEKDGEIIVIRVAVLPEQIPLGPEEEWVEPERLIIRQALEHAKDLDVPVSSLVSVAHHAGRAILETARSHSCNLILLGWKGYTTTAQKILGEDADAVVSHAKCDIMLAKLPPTIPLGGGRILLPTAGGPHARAAEQYAVAISKQLSGSISVCNIADPGIMGATRIETEERLDQAMKRVRRLGAPRVDSKLILNESVSTGILEASADYDLIVLGATRESFYPQMLFGSIPERIARQSDKPVIMVKLYHPIQNLLRRLFGS